MSKPTLVELSYEVQQEAEQGHYEDPAEWYCFAECCTLGEARAVKRRLKLSEPSVNVRIVLYRTYATDVR